MARKKREKVCTAYQVNLGYFYGICEKKENLTLNCNCLSLSTSLDFNHPFLLIDVQMLSPLSLAWEGNYVYAKQEGSLHFYTVFLAF